MGPAKIAYEYKRLYAIAKVLGPIRSMNFERDLRIMHTKFCEDAAPVTDEPKTGN